MKDIKEIREQINLIDKEMAKLFEKRMQLSKSVAEYKMNLELPIYDKDREKQVIENNSKLIKDNIIKEYYIEYLQFLMDVSKKYQNYVIKDMNISYCNENESSRKKY